MFKPTTRQSLEYFYRVAELGSIRAAAEHLRIAASAVSRKVSQLEYEFGVELVVRQARGIRLTEAGEIVHRYLKESRVRDALLYETIDDIRGLRAGHVTVATGSGFVDGIVSSVLAGFVTERPGIRIEILTVPADEIVEAVLEDDAEIGIVFGSLGEAGTRVVREVEHPIRLLVAPGHPLAGSRAVPLSEVAAFPIALPPATAGIRQAVEQAFRSAGMKVEAALTVGPVQGLIRFAAAGAGATFLPAFSCRAEIERGELVPVDIEGDPVPVTRASVFVRQERHLSPAASALLKHLESTFPFVE